MSENKDILDYLKKREVGTPDKSYFNDLANSVIQEQSGGTVIPLYRKLIYWSSSVAAMLLVSFFLFRSSTNTEVDLLAQFEQISTDELLAYVDDNIDEFETDLIVESLTDDELLTLDEELSPIVTIESNPEESQLSFDVLDENDIKDYLESEGMDIEDLEYDFI